MPNEKKKHLEFLGEPIPHDRVGALDGGKCIAKHVSPYKESCSCSHRWHAFEKALENAHLYRLTSKQIKQLGSDTWMQHFRGFDTHVTSLAQRGETVARSLLNKSMYLREVPKPKKGDWDVARSKENFKDYCNVPYYHEAHHLVPDATLRGTLLAIFGEEGGGSNELAIQVLTEVLNSPYNVHHKDNMMILPMDEHVGDALQLPIHRETTNCNHTTYDTYVESLLTARLRGTLEEIMKRHDEEGTPPQYADLAQSIRDISGQLYDAVSKGRRIEGFQSVEQMGQTLLNGAPPPPA